MVSMHVVASPRRNVGRRRALELAPEDPTAIGEDRCVGTVWVGHHGEGRELKEPHRRGPDLLPAKGTLGKVPSHRGLRNSSAAGQVAKWLV